MALSLKEFMELDLQSDIQISESLVGKAYSIGQNRQHASHRNKLNSIASRIQSTARKGISENEHEKREELLFHLFFDLAEALKTLSDMERNTINVGTAGVLDTENIKKELRKAFPKHFKGR